MILAKPVPDPAHGVIRFEGPVVSQAAQVIDQLEQFGPAVAAGLLRWKVGFTAGFLPSRFPGFVSQRIARGPPDSVGDISRHSASDLHACNARANSAKSSLVRDYLD